MENPKSETNKIIDIGNIELERIVLFFFFDS